MNKNNYITITPALLQLEKRRFQITRLACYSKILHYFSVIIRTVKTAINNEKYIDM